MILTLLFGWTLFSYFIYPNVEGCYIQSRIEKHCHKLEVEGSIISYEGRHGTEIN